MSMKQFANRRKKLYSLLGDGIAIIYNNSEKIRSNDTHYIFRPNSNFWYLSGFKESNSLIIIDATNKKSIMYCKQKNSLAERWHGYIIGQAKAKNTFYFDEARNIEDFEQDLCGLLANQKTLWHSYGGDENLDNIILSTISNIKKSWRTGQKPPQNTKDIDNVIYQMRKYKDIFEINLLKKSCSIADLAHVRAMKACKPNISEKILEAEIIHEFLINDTDGHSYNPIVAGGKNALILHYNDNNKLLNNDELVLIDAGCEYQGYASDITRTIPINGKFAGLKKELYNICLEAQKQAILAARPSVKFNAPHLAAVKVIAEGLKHIGLLSGTMDEILNNEKYRKYFIHKTSHLLGIDVHDVGTVIDDNQEYLNLEPGMVITIEPGIYVPKQSSIHDSISNTGIRIEDDVLITDNGNEVLTKAPKETDDIEYIMRNI